MKRLWLFLLCGSLFAAGIVPNRYIVELSSEPVAVRVARVLGPGQQGRRALLSVEARQHRSRIHAEQDAVRTRLEGAGARVTRSLDTVANVLVVEIADAKAASLAQLPGVRRVLPVRQFHLLLDHALPLHKVPDAWNQVGIGNAGAGIKIGMIDTGIDAAHPGFQDPSLPVPDGFPKVNADSDKDFTNNKVIVARSYADMFDRPDPDPSARDHVGHGTATAMAAAGVQNTGPLAVISGVAPKAYLGNYKVFGTPGVNDGAPEDAILKAIEDAVSDGMDILNLSFGTNISSRLEEDPEVQALDNAASLGVLVVVAAGNNGPDLNTIGSPAGAPSAITVGGSSNDRIFSAFATVSGGGPYVAIPGSGPVPANPITAPLMDVAKLDSNGLACSDLPSNSLSGSIAFILRGTCFFEVKLGNAQRAGAVGALVYTYQDQPDPITMAVGSVTLPAEMVSYESGLDIKYRLTSSLQATLQFTLGPVYLNPDRLASFAARGPSVDWSIKPDLVAVGTSMYTAAEKSDPNGDIYSPDGYSIESGTSFSTPLVSGATALIKAARPGLTTDQYRSLLINSAARISSIPGTPAHVQEAGAGTLDVSAAVRSTAALSPASLSFGTGGKDAQLSRNLLLSNIGTATETFLLSVLPYDGGPAPVLSTSSVQLDPGASANVTVSFSGSSLEARQYDGFIAIQGTLSGVESHVPYWYAFPSGTPRYITVLESNDSQRAGTSVTDAIVFHVSDASGIYIDTVQPTATVVSGGGDVLRVRSRTGISPGAFSISVRLGVGRGPNVFRIAAGDITKDVTLIGN